MDQERCGGGRDPTVRLGLGEKTEDQKEDCIHKVKMTGQLLGHRRGGEVTVSKTTTQAASRPSLQHFSPKFLESVCVCVYVGGCQGSTSRCTRVIVSSC